LGLSHHERYEPELRAGIHLHREWHLLAFEAENDDSRWLAELLERGLSSVKNRLESRPHLLSTFDDLVFQNAKHGGTVTVVLSPDVPSDGTREGSREEGTAGDLRVVLHSGLVRYVKERRVAIESSAEHGSSIRSSSGSTALARAMHRAAHRSMRSAWSPLKRFKRSPNATFLAMLMANGFGC
jgi:hypothetical protein